LTILILADLAPVAPGVNFTVKVVEDRPATVELGEEITEKSEGFVPEKLIAPIVKVILPVF